MGGIKYRIFGKLVEPMIEPAEDSPVGHDDLKAYARGVDGSVGEGWPKVDIDGDTVKLALPLSETVVRPEGDGTYDVGKFLSNPPMRNVDGKSEPWPGDAPATSLHNADAATALAFVRAEVNEALRYGPDPKHDADNPVEDGFSTGDDVPNEQGMHVINPFECGGGMFPANPDVEYGRYYREWRDNPPIPEPRAKP